MPSLAIRLFGKFSAESDGQRLDGIDGGKLQELFCYLLLNRCRPHSREVLAAMLWGDCPTAQSKKYLRQALWQLQTALSFPEQKRNRLLLIDADWVSVNSEADYWFDVREFERSFGEAQGAGGQRFEPDTAARVAKAVDLYRGELLEGRFDDWCLVERERLQNIYLMMLDKLMAYSEAAKHYEAGIGYGARILSCDRAREHTHRRLMRIYYLAGDRTSALREYDRCVAALKEELGVNPARKTSQLFEQIRSDQLETVDALSGSGDSEGVPISQICEALGRLRQVKIALVHFHRQIKDDIHALEGLVNGKRDGG
ncbi:MAG TPA: BTAD domain-containing putative transcriptional regulator [Blastocatellia bacterium]|nr:BTAD domain-containing putative transcriptional regulator [Blastocatellia bacterium]